MKSVIQDLRGNRLYYEEIPLYNKQHTFFASDGKILKVSMQWPPDELMDIDVVDGFNLGSIGYYTPKHSTMWYNLNHRFGTTLVEDLSVFRKQTIPNLVRTVYVSNKVTKKHIKQIKKLYDTSNWIWP